MLNGIIEIMERLDQGHLHPLLNVPRHTFLARESNPGLREHSSKELSEQRINSYSQHLHTYEPVTKSVFCKVHNDFFINSYHTIGTELYNFSLGLRRPNSLDRKRRALRGTVLIFLYIKMSDFRPFLELVKCKIRLPDM